jgi:DNA (cytosine-5)-methyltransferase 1
MSVAVIDFFCGIGGLSHGLHLAGLHTVLGVDTDASCRYAYEANNYAEFISCDVAKIPIETIRRCYDRYGRAKVKVLAGCAPCQPFSRYSIRYHHGNRQGNQWKLLEVFAKRIKEISPDVVVMENVPDLEREPIFTRFWKSLRKQGYQTNAYIVHCVEYGIPQTRKRLILLASQLGDLQLLPPTHTPDNYRTVRQTIGMMPPLRAGEQDANDSLHVCGGMSALTLRRIRASRPGGTWRDWDESLRLYCHNVTKTGDGYGNVYGRMSYDEPSPTLTTKFYNYGCGRFGHPEQDRAISLREGAMLQSFPKDYQFVPEGAAVKIEPIAKHIGNAVPVELGRVIGESILRHL